MTVSLPPPPPPRFRSRLKTGHKGFFLSLNFVALEEFLGFLTLCAAFIEICSLYAKQVDLYCSLAALCIYTHVKVYLHRKYLMFFFFFLSDLSFRPNLFLCLNPKVPQP